MDLASSVDFSIPFVAGLYMAGVGFGYFPPPNTHASATDVWMERNAGIFKLLGIGLIVITLIRILSKISS